MIKLPGTCSCSEMKVTPKDWSSARSIKRDWFIYYRFYDSSQKEQYPKGKLIILKGMNKYKDIQMRRENTKFLMAAELEKLHKKFNPILKIKPAIDIPEDETELTKKTPFISALYKAADIMQKQVSQNTMSGEILWIIGQLESAAKALHLDNLNIWDVTLKHLFLICERASTRDKKNGGGYSGDKFNRNKKVLRQLYKKLVLLEVAPVNYPLSLERQKGAARKKKVLLTKDERKKLVEYLESKSPRFLLFIQIFFHSGGRLTEVLRLKKSDVDFKKGYVTYLEMKGRQYQYKERPIKNIAVKYWDEAIKCAKQNDYIFGKDLMPGLDPITPNAIKKRWQRVQKALSIKATFYAFKHANTTEIVKLIGVKGAAAQNNESEEMIIKVYDVDNKKNIDDIVKEVNNEF